MRQILVANTTDTDPLEQRVLVVAPTARDANTTRTLLASGGIAVETCASVEELLAEMRRGAAAILIPEEAVGEASSGLRELLRQQPAWSDLPVLVLTRAGAKSLATVEAVRMLGNVTLLERPLRIATLLSAVRTAMRARGRQMQVRELLSERARADQRKDEFLATLGHELRNPLAPLVTGLHLIKTSGSHDPSVAKVTPILERQVQHMVRLVDDLLEVSRITRGLVEIQREPLDLVLALRAAIDTARPVLDASAHTLHTRLPEHPIPVVGDVVRLTQVFANLLTNAAKYTNRGGTIDLSVQRTEGRVAVSVRDNGIGIAQAQLDSVFEMFMQVDRHDRRAQGGLGIGLTLVRSLVAMHGGTVSAKSAGPGLGSEFIVELPTSRVAPDVPAPATLEPFPGRRLMVVDDNRDAADTLAELLRSLGATVAVAHSGQEALDLWETFRPESMLLDIGMPGMDGYAVARHIRERPGGGATVLIALTGWGQDQDVQHSREAGFDHHLVKPPDMEKLRAVLSIER